MQKNFRALCSLVIKRAGATATEKSKIESQVLM